MNNKPMTYLDIQNTLENCTLPQLESFQVQLTAECLPIPVLLKDAVSNKRMEMANQRLLQLLENPVGVKTGVSIKGK